MSSDSDFAGKGGKRPLLNININLINLDEENPRLSPYLDKNTGNSQTDLVEVLYKYFDSEPIALSLVENGYFDEEPIIAIPENLPDDFDFDRSTEELTKAYQELIDKNEIEFIVVEGNRRVSAIKLILDRQIRRELNVDGFYPSTNNKDKIYDISNIPTIIYPKREDSFKYLGVRHIAGLLKWEAYAQAKYVNSLIESEKENGKTTKEALAYVKKIIASRTDTFHKQYISYQLFETAKEELEGYDVRSIIDKFSLLTVLYNTGSIREYLGLKSYKQVNFNEPIIKDTHYDKFRQVLTWVYGDKARGKTNAITDSRKITSHLAQIVTKSEAIVYLDEYNDIEGAFDRTTSERDYLIKKIKTATKAIKSSLSFAYKYTGDEEAMQSIKELEEVLEVLKKNIN